MKDALSLNYTPYLGTLYGKGTCSKHLIASDSFYFISFRSPESGCRSMHWNTVVLELGFCKSMGYWCRGSETRLDRAWDIIYEKRITDLLALPVRRYPFAAMLPIHQRLLEQQASKSLSTLYAINGALAMDLVKGYTIIEHLLLLVSKMAQAVPYNDATHQCWWCREETLGHTLAWALAVECPYIVIDCPWCQMLYLLVKSLTSERRLGLRI